MVLVSPVTHMSTSDVSPEKMPTGKVVRSSWKGSDLLENVEEGSVYLG